MKNSFDIIVVGAGHAGIEAALAATRLGCQTLLLTSNIERMGYMSCNPSIGGLGKGHMVKELDILGGEMGVAADATCIQFRRLNASRGPAVRGSRAQCDKDLYCNYMKKKLLSTPHLTVVEGEAKSLILNQDICSGVMVLNSSQNLEPVFSRAVVITTGTFMRAVMHFGLTRVEGGRIGDRSTIGLSDQLVEHGFQVTRLKTGTPGRAHKDSIDWSELTAQEGDDQFIPFSLRSPKTLSLPQIQCFITHTNERTHEIIRRNFDKSPMFCGIIEGVGPRYCPSIEDKIFRFADKESHQSFLEPEGLNTDSVYIQGLSTSLPEDIQYDFLRTMPGLSRVKLLKPGYAVEYDAVNPQELTHSLETKKIKNLFLAGQVNSTSGYEEAAAQGLLAGANAALKIKNLEPIVFKRSDAYMGVLIDDLVIKGTKEPYRMMTSRAEYRLVLREDNVLERLFVVARERQLISDSLAAQYESLLNQRARFKAQLESGQVVPNEETQSKLKQISSAPLTKPFKYSDLLRREEVNATTLSLFGLEIPEDRDVWEPVEIEIKYEGYVKRQNQFIDQAARLDSARIPSTIDYNKVSGLSLEEVEKLNALRPETVAQVSRMSGVNPSAIQALIIYLAKEKKNGSNRDMANSRLV